MTDTAESLLKELATTLDASGKMNGLVDPSDHQRLGALKLSTADGALWKRVNDFLEKLPTS